MPQMQIRRAIGVEKLPRDAVEAVCVGVMLVVAGFLPDKQHNYDATRHSDGKPENVDEGVEFVATHGAKRGYEVVGEHGDFRLEW